MSLVRSLVSDDCFRELLRAKELLSDCYRQPLLLEDAATSIHLSPWHFQREFRRAFGETPHSYVTRLRIEQAKRLLERTRLSVMEVCLEVGFQSLGSFTTFFKRHVGMPPARYRRTVQSVVAVNGIRDLVHVPFCFLQKTVGG